jgi:hypothetical protein
MEVWGDGRAWKHAWVTRISTLICATVYSLSNISVVVIVESGILAYIWPNAAQSGVLIQAVTYFLLSALGVVSAVNFSIRVNTKNETSIVQKSAQSRREVAPVIDKAARAKAQADLDRVSKRRLQIVQHMADGTNVVAQLAKKVDAHRNTVADDLKALEAEGIVHKNGKGWEVA